MVLVSRTEKQETGIVSVEEGGMKYKGKVYDTYTGIIDHAMSLKGREQELFVRAYLKSGKHARSNIGYISGYYGPRQMKKIQKIFKTQHPVFGPAQ